MLTDKYRIGYYKYHAKALMRCKDPSTGTVFLKFQPVSVNSSLLVCLATPEISKTIAISELSQVYNKIIVDAIKYNTDIKRRIGKTTWTVEFIDLVVKVYKDVIIFKGEEIEP